MATYHIAAGAPVNLRRRALSQLARTVFFLVWYVATWRVIQGRWLDPAFLVILGAVWFLGTLITNFLWPRKAPSYDLDIDDDGIRLLWSGKLVRNVRRERVRYVGEWGSGMFRKLVVSEKGPVFTRMLWGGIWVPAKLPEYDQIKAQALTWLENSGPQ